MNSMKAELEILAARVQKLEAQNRWWKLGSALIALFCISLLLMAAKAANRSESTVIRARTVEAQDFLLKDEDGRVYARLSMNPGGKLVKRDGRVYMIPNQETPGQAALEFYDEKGTIVWTAPGKAEFMPAK
jgi:hypothetical protein